MWINITRKRKWATFFKKLLMKHKGRLPTFQNSEDTQILFCVSLVSDATKRKESRWPSSDLEAVSVIQPWEGPIKPEHSPSRAQLPCRGSHAPWASTGDDFRGPCHHCRFKGQWHVPSLPTPQVECWSFSTTSGKLQLGSTVPWPQPFKMSQRNTEQRGHREARLAEGRAEKLSSPVLLVQDMWLPYLPGRSPTALQGTAASI